MIKEIFKTKEPIAYASLNNDLRSGHLAHSYLFYGELNPLKRDVAFLLAQSIIEGKAEYACEECETCKRIAKGSYFDVIYLDGHKEVIKKEQIERIMNEFAKTSLERAGKRIYIIDNINNASPKVLNMILKFMEEPSSEEIYGIFITDNIATLLPTIVSRCQKIPFKTVDFSDLIKDYQTKGFNYIDAYLLSLTRHELLNIEATDEIYNVAKEHVYKTIDNLSNKDYLPILFTKEFHKAVSNDDFKTCSDYYLDIMLQMLEDALGEKKIADEEYMYYLDLLKNDNLPKLLAIFLEAKNRTNVPINRQLLFDQIASKIILY